MTKTAKLYRQQVSELNKKMNEYIDYMKTAQNHIHLFKNFRFFLKVQ